MQSRATQTAPRRTAKQKVLRVGSVSFLNAKPLIHGLEHSPDLELGLDVPSGLLDDLRARRFDVALLPVIDYQRMERLKLLTSGGIGCDGPTLTVRVFSPVPADQIRTLACDTDSHTSVALARILLAERYGVRPEFIPLDRIQGGDGSTSPGVARLLIGDKVVREEPHRLATPHQLDLGEEWKRHTGLPFVFAAWMGRPGVDLGDLPQRLEAAKRQGMAHVNEIVRRHAIPHGWPEPLARRYLTQYLNFDIGPRQIEAIGLFHRLAAEHGVIPSPPREVELYGV